MKKRIIKTGGLNNMIVMNWNICYASRIQDIIAELKRNVGNHDFIITLQEVIPSSYDALAYAFDGIANVRYSLDYRRPGKFDNKSRQLGVMILTSSGITVEDAGVLQRTMLPDRTLYVHVCANGKKMLIISLHSITGCDYVRAKALQFLSWAEAVDEMKPDIVTFDSNEPKTDSYDIAKMQFFDNTDMGKGAQTSMPEKSSRMPGKLLSVKHRSSLYESD